MGWNVCPLHLTKAGSAFASSSWKIAQGEAAMSLDGKLIFLRRHGGIAKIFEVM